MIKKLIFVFISLLSIQSTFAADIPRLKELFEANFTAPFYTAASGRLTEKFIRLALSHGIDMKGAAFARLTGKDDDDDGIFYPLYEIRDNARFFKFNLKNGKPNKAPEPEMEIFHDFLLADGYVFDLQFKNSPTVVTLEEYAKEMLIPRKKHGDSQYINHEFTNYFITLLYLKQIAPSDANRVQPFELFEAGPMNLIPILEVIESSLKNK
jgi:hypothetical protein